MTTLRRLVRASIVTILVFAAVTVGLGSPVLINLRPWLQLSQTKAVVWIIPGCGYDLPVVQNAGYPGGYQVSEGAAAIAREKYFFIGQVCLA